MGAIVGRRLSILVVLLTLLAALPSRAVPDPGADAELLVIQERLSASAYEEVLTLGTELLAEIAVAEPAIPLREAQVLDLMVNAGYRSAAVMEPRFLAMAERSLALNEEHAGAVSLPVATSLMHMGNLLSQRGDWDLSIEYYQRSIDILAALGSEQDQQRAVVLSSKGVALRRSGDYDSARRCYGQALAIQERVLGVDHPDVAATLNNLAIVNRSLGNLQRSRDMYRRALKIREEYFGPEHEWVAETLHNLANVETALGAYDEALKVQERAVAIFRVTLGEDHQRYIWARLNLGISYLEMGDFVNATPVCEEALAAAQRIFGPEHIDTTYCLDALGSCRYKAGRFEEALVLYAHSLAIIDEAIGKNNPEGGETMFEVGRCQLALGRLTEGLATMSHALALREEAVGPDSSELCEMLHYVGDAHRRLERPGDALGFARHAERILRRATGTDHPIYARALLQEARARAALGETERAVTLALTAENISRRHLQRTMRVLSEARALDYAAHRAQGLDLALSLLPLGVPDALVTEAWDTLIRSRAVVLDEFTDRNTTLSAEAGPQAAAALDSSLVVRQYLANLSLRGPGYGDDAKYLQTLEASRQELDRLERQLSLADAGLSRKREARELGQAEVWAELTPGTALVSYVLYQRPVGDPADDRYEDQVMAFVASADLAGPVAVDLGPAAVITDLVGDWRDQVRFGSRSLGPGMARAERGLVQVKQGAGGGGLEAYQAAARLLRQAVWDPLAPWTGRSDRVFMVPDGILHRVNFATLPAGDGKFMVEDGPLLHTLMTERSLVRLADVTEDRPGVLAIGGPAFGTCAELSGSEDGGPAELRGLRFVPLPYARAEVDELAGLWRETSGGPDHVLILTGAAATEDAFRRNIGGRGILHLATHGFVLASDHDTDAVMDRDRTGSLNRTGLALAGANDWTRDDTGCQDGIMTAAEISALDMSGVDWAVLSACDTGLGDLTASSEGVFGLCRAFALAGARTVVVSLWPVGDESTRDWMRALYTAHLVDGLDTAEAVRFAHQTVLATRRAHGLSGHPYFWAGFTAVGDWQ